MKASELPPETGKSCFQAVSSCDVSTARCPGTLARGVPLSLTDPDTDPAPGSPRIVAFGRLRVAVRADNAVRSLQKHIDERAAETAGCAGHEYPRATGDLRHPAGSFELAHDVSPLQ